MHVAEIEHGLSIAHHIGGESILLNGLFVIHLCAQTVEVVVAQPYA